MSASLEKDGPLYVSLKPELHQDLFIHLSHKTKSFWFVTWSMFCWPSVVLFTLFQILPLLQKSLSDGVSTCQSLQSDTLMWNKIIDFEFMHCLQAAAHNHIYFCLTLISVKNWWCKLRPVIAQAISMNWTFKSTQRKSCIYVLLYCDHIHHPSCSLCNLTPNFSGQLWSRDAQTLPGMRRKSSKALWARKHSQG